MREKEILQNGNVFPAPAGVIPVRKDVLQGEPGFPRTCGGDPSKFVFTLYAPSFSPHLRG